MTFDAYKTLEQIKLLKDSNPLECLSEMIFLSNKEKGFNHVLKEIFYDLFLTEKINWKTLAEFKYKKDNECKIIGFNYFFASKKEWMENCFKDFSFVLKKDKNLFLEVCKAIFSSRFLQKEENYKLFMLFDDNQKQQLLPFLSSFDDLNFFVDNGVLLWDRVLRKEKEVFLPFSVILNARNFFKQRGTNFKDQSIAEFLKILKSKQNIIDEDDLPKKLKFNTQVAFILFCLLGEKDGLLKCRELEIKEIDLNNDIDLFK